MEEEGRRSGVARAKVHVDFDEIGLIISPKEALRSEGGGSWGSLLRRSIMDGRAVWCGAVLLELEFCQLAKYQCPPRTI